jgi:prepilin-type N-terminal cleavage/methylation domain-containing protein
MNRKGFTLIELLIVIAILGILAAAILVAVDPVGRIQEARDARRWSEANGLLNAMLNYQVDIRDQYDGEVGAPIDATVASSQVIVRSVGTVDCDTPASAPTCPDDGSLSLPVTDGTTCVALITDLAPTYIAELPIDPIGSGNDATPGVTDLVLGDSNTGYWINRNNGGRIEIGACHGEQNNSISVRR